MNYIKILEPQGSIALPGTQSDEGNTIAETLVKGQVWTYPVRGAKQGA